MTNQQMLANEHFVRAVRQLDFDFKGTPRLQTPVPVVWWIICAFSKILQTFELGPGLEVESLFGRLHHCHLLRFLDKMVLVAETWSQLKADQSWSKLGCRYFRKLCISYHFFLFISCSLVYFESFWIRFDAQISTAVHYILRVSSFATKAELARFVSQGASDPDAFAGRLWCIHSVSGSERAVESGEWRRVEESGGEVAPKLQGLDIVLGHCEKKMVAFLMFAPSLTSLNDALLIFNIL